MENNSTAIKPIEMISETVSFEYHDRKDINANLRILKEATVVSKDSTRTLIILGRTSVGYCIIAADIVADCLAKGTTHSIHLPTAPVQQDS